MSNNNWINKLQIDFTEQEDGSLHINIDWDETDPDLALWNSWGEDLQREFIYESLLHACEQAVGEDLTDLVD